MPRKRLTDASVPRLKHTGGGKYTDYQDGSIPGLTLRVYPTGARTWWHRHRGSSHRKKIGNYPEMSLERAIETCVQRLTVRDLDAPSKRTVSDLIEHYKSNYRTRIKRRKLTDQSGDALYLRELQQNFGQLLISELGPDHVRAYLARWSDKPYAQNRALQRIRAMYRWASEIDWFDGKMPTRGIQMNREMPRSRAVTTPEVGAMLADLWENEAPQIAAAVEFTAIYGWRIGETIALRWEDVTPTSVTIPDGKNGEPHTVPITERAQELLDQQRKVSGHTPWLFVGVGSHLGYRAVYDAWRRSLLRTGVRSVQLKDLRHHLVSSLRRARVPRKTVASITGHKDLRVMDRSYHDVSFEETKDTLEREKSPGSWRVADGDI